MSALAALEQEFLSAGGTKDRFKQEAHGELGVTDLGRQDGDVHPGEARNRALQSVRPGMIIEYDCYNESGRPQGQALARFERWEFQDQLQFRATHLAASDEYYEWWAGKNLDPLGVVYHFCEAKRARCRTPPVEGMENIHITKWRLLSPLMAIDTRYGEQAGLAELRRRLENVLAVSLEQVEPLLGLLVWMRFWMISQGLPEKMTLVLRR